MISSVVGDAFSPDDGTSCDLEKSPFEYLEIPVKESVYCASSTRYKLFFKIAVKDIYRESFRELESKFQHLSEKKYLQIDFATIETESLKHCGLNFDINCVETLTILSNCFLDTEKTDETTKVSNFALSKILQEALFCVFERHAVKLECFVMVCRNNIHWTKCTTSGFRSICKKDWSAHYSLLSLRVSSPLSGATMEVHCNSHHEEHSSDGENLFNLRRQVSPMQDPSCTLCRRLGGSRIPSVPMTTAAVTSSKQLQACLHSLSTKETSTLSPVSEGHVRRVSLIQNRKMSHAEDLHPMQNSLTNYSYCKNNNMNNCISTSCQSSSHNQFSRSRTVVSVNSSHQCNSKCNGRRSNSSNYVSNCSRGVIGDNNRTISSKAESSVICWPSMPVFEGNCYLTQQPPHTTTSATELQPRRWSLTSPCPRSRSTSPSDGVLTSSWCTNTYRTHQSPSPAEHCDDTSLSSASSLSSLCSSSKRLTPNNCSRRRCSRLSTRSSDHSTEKPNSVRSSPRELRKRDGGQLGLGSCNADYATETAGVTTTSTTSLLPVSCTGCDSSCMEGKPTFRVPLNIGVTSTEGSSSTPPVAGSVPSSLPRQRSPIQPSGILHRTSISPASPVASLPMSSVDSNAPQLRQRPVLPTVEQGEMATQRSPMRHRVISKRAQRMHPLLGLWNFLTQATSSSNRRDGTTALKMSQVWTCLLSLMLVVTVLPNVAECCSSRSTPRPRPSSPTLRPNITFQTYACPPAYAAWYCLNGATCFTVKISEAILYNCECAEGYMGQRCEFKNLDGSYPPTSEKVLLETASIAGGATVVIVLVFFVIFSVFLVRNRDNETRDLEGFSRINININSGAATSWPANGDGSHQSPSYSQRTSHTFVTSPTGALATSPHTTTISSPPHHMQPGQGCNHHHHHDSPHGCQAASGPTESVVDGKCFVSELGGDGGGTMMMDGGLKGMAVTPTAGDAFYGVPARVVRTVTTITDLASIYTNPRQEVHQVEVLQQVNVLKVDQSKACYNATFVRPSSNASTTALFRGPMWQDASHSTADRVSSAPLSWQQFKATSWLSSSPSKTPGNLSVMPQRDSPASDKVALDMVPGASHVVVPYSEQVTRVAHSSVTLAMASHAAELDGREQLQPSPTTLILANSKMPFDLDSELNSRLNVDENDASITVRISGGDDCCANYQSKAHQVSTPECTANSLNDSSSDAECRRAIGAVNQAFDSGEDNIVNRSYAADQDYDESSRASDNAPQPLIFGAKNTERY